MGRSLLIRDQKLVFSCVFIGRLDVFFGGLKAEECLFKNEIRS
jgi:ATP-dependent Zn protease